MLRVMTRKGWNGLILIQLLQMCFGPDLSTGAYSSSCVWGGWFGLEDMRGKIVWSAGKSVVFKPMVPEGGAWKRKEREWFLAE